MSSCIKSNTGLHTFHFSVVNPELEPILQSYITCIACGERRAIGVLGDLLVRENKEWVKMEPEHE